MVVEFLEGEPVLSVHFHHYQRVNSLLLIAFGPIDLQPLPSEPGIR